MPPGVDLTEVQENQILTLQAEGVTFTEIAQRVGIHRNTVGLFCKKHFRNVEMIQEAQKRVRRSNLLDRIEEVAKGKQEPQYDSDGKFVGFIGPSDRDSIAAGKMLLDYSGATTNGHADQADENLQDIPDSQLLAALNRNFEILQQLVVNKVTGG